MPPTTLIYTNSLDLTTDLLIANSEGRNIYRFNFDLWRDYAVTIDRRGFRIENPAGGIVTSGDIAKVYWRKPFTTQRLYPERKISEEDLYREEELSYALRDMINILWAEGKLALVEPLADLRVGKFVQLRVAERYFSVPPYTFRLGPAGPPQRRSSIVKSLTSRRVSGNAVVYATRVDEHQLDPATPWMVQEYIEASLDVTVAFVRGRLFAFALERGAFLEQTADWRELGPDRATDAWLPHRLPGDLEQGITAFMDDLGLHYGRIDMLLAKGVYYFLEVNPNGEWAWLDFEGKHGLRRAILDELDPLTPCRGIPVPRRIRISDRKRT